VLPNAPSGRFHLFSRSADLDLHEVYGGPRVSLRRLKYAGSELSLGVVHVVDKLNWDTANQSNQVQLLAAEIGRQEFALKHDRTLLIGDFNMNPFDQAMNMATGLNAMMTEKCVARLSRKQQDQDYPFFYNPMWNLFGDRTPGPPGTYYHTSSSQGMYGWNMLDQVLVRPSALPWFDKVEILTAAGSSSLLNKSERPNKNIASDHFPILVKLK
jgi:endonuclease/exonuclease/phosphatase family metal-dependent hydrolase